MGQLSHDLDKLEPLKDSRSPHSRSFVHRGILFSPVLARKNHSLGESTSSLRARKLLNRRCASVQEPVLKLRIRNNLFLNSALRKAADLVRRSRRILLPEPAALTNL